uniref:Reverse transcriptase domain-containing protein n=1 Tax=Nicotiana tabacum TaxID=4097 RepID=A0A1S3Y8E7_TOBAC|nr:PREDICTED: uncharacterized protein LOC107773693 [Nicotiana tabacum]
MTYVQSITYTIILNGSPTQPFEARKGLRQGDPLSPFLFVLAMEYLTRRLKALHCIPDLNFHPKCAKMQIMQLGFVDDLLLFCKGDTISVQLLYNCFLDFSRASGLEINKQKSSIFFGGVSQDVQKEILEFLGIQRGELLITKLVEAICKSFLWTRDSNISKKALLAWEKVCQPRNIYGWSKELLWVENWARNRSAKAELFKVVLAGCVYFVWQERNARLFQAKSRNCEILSKLIVQEVQCQSNRKIEKIMNRLDYYPK